MNQASLISLKTIVIMMELTRYFHSVWVVDAVRLWLRAVLRPVKVTIILHKTQILKL